MAETKIAKLLEAFQGNAYPAMLEHLALHLGVSADSLRRLALGWVPVVQFKKKTSFSGWWAAPERDAEATVTGLSLRNQHDDKTAYPGSKHGLIYEVNPDHEHGEKGYSNGAHNWVRTMDAGLPCAVCGKPDGCLLSAENPADPKAAVCIRQESPTRLKFGYLHILKEAGQLAGKSALPDNGGPVVVVEGMSDTAAAMDLGFNAVGRPSNLACLDMLADLVRGRSVVIVGENDKYIEHGVEKWPGKEGMIAAFQAVSRVTKDVKMLMPPEHVKDLRAWVAKYKLTHDQLIEAVEKDGQAKQSDLMIADDRPTTIARAFLDSQYRIAGRYILRQWEESWYTYRNGKYVSLKEAEVIQPLYQWAYDKMVHREDHTGKSSFAPLVMNTHMVGNMKQAMMAETLVPAKQLPCWINDVTGPDPRDLIVFQNGILHVPSFLAGQADLIDLTPDLFTTAALPINFDPNATCPAWDSFRESSLGDEPAKIDLLQEWMGYVMTPDRSMHKMMFLRGPTAAGKSRVLEVLEALVGSEQTAASSLADLAGPFGLAPLLGKLLCVVPDARTPKQWDSMKGLEVLLNITGDDSVSINRKFKDQLAGQRLMCRVTIASNEFLDVPDHAGAMVRRLNVIDFARSFVGREDFNLPEKLRAELPGIAVWALGGLKRLRENGVFTIPPSSRNALSEWRTSTSPIAAFLEECTDAEGEVSKDELYDAWAGWSTERKIWQMSKSRFYERIKSNATYAASDTYEKGGHKFSVFRGITLKKWAAKKFTGRPQ